MRGLLKVLVLAPMSFCVASTLLSCYTHQSISESEFVSGHPKPEQSVRIVLRDGSVIDSPGFLHIVTNEPTDVIVGIGQDRSTSRAFNGILAPGDLDSVKKVPTADGLSLVCWLKNRTSLGFKEGQFLMLTIQDPPGLRCIGQKTSSVGGAHISNNSADFRGRLSRDQVERMERTDLNHGNTALVILAPIVGLRCFHSDSILWRRSVPLASTNSIQPDL